MIVRHSQPAESTACEVDCCFTGGGSGALQGALLSARPLPLHPRRPPLRGPVPTRGPLQPPVFQPLSPSASPPPFPVPPCPRRRLSRRELHEGPLVLRWRHRRLGPREEARPRPPSTGPGEASAGLLGRARPQTLRPPSSRPGRRLRIPRRPSSPRPARRPPPRQLEGAAATSSWASGWAASTTATGGALMSSASGASASAAASASTFNHWWGEASCLRLEDRGR